MLKKHVKISRKQLKPDQTNAKTGVVFARIGLKPAAKEK